MFVGRNKYVAFYLYYKYNYKLLTATGYNIDLFVCLIELIMFC